MPSSDSVVRIDFDVSIDLDPLTTVSSRLAADVERYLQRYATGPLTVTVAGTSGTVRQGGRLIACFAVNSLTSAQSAPAVAA